MTTSIRRITTGIAAAAALAAGAAAPAVAAPTPTTISASKATTASIQQIKPIYTINFRPVFNDYLYCLKDATQNKAWVYADFTDANDNDENLVVDISGYYGPSGPMSVSNGYHGVFFYQQMNLPYAHTILTLKATDPHGAVSDTWQVWLYADGHCGTPWKA